MLPQMMPLPWFLVFLFIFACLYSSAFFIGCFSFSSSVDLKNTLSSFDNLPW